MELSIQERLKDLRVERGLTLEQLADLRLSHCRRCECNDYEADNPGLTDLQLRQLIASHIDDDSFCRYVTQQDIKKWLKRIAQKWDLLKFPVS